MREPIATAPAMELTPPAIHTLVEPNGSFKPELQAYQDALATLKSQHPILWTKISQFHDIFCVGAGNEEVHGNWRFLAWHRAYLVTLERVLREVSSNASSHGIGVIPGSVRGDGGRDAGDGISGGLCVAKATMT